jgi:hypothetical protein
MKMLRFLLIFLMAAACNSAKKAERVFGDDLFQHWTHLHEEDGDGYRTFRPSGYDFPPARGREGFEIKKGGEFIHHQIGPVDVPVQAPGKWVMKGKNTLAVTPAEGQAFELVILEVKKEVLKLKN